MDPDSRPLFDAFPGTREIPWVRLASLPTPVDDCPSLAENTGASSFAIKRDDLTGEHYGGNKVRKLEFLLGSAIDKCASDVITFGAAGSNHALATAVYGAAHNLRVHSMLMRQPNARYVRRNILASLAAGADLHHFADTAAALRGASRLRRALRSRTGRDPLVIPFGGTTPVSTVGHVNAAFELASQVEAGLLPEPDLVFVALGSWGTAAGLALGLRAAGLRSRVVAVPVISEDSGSPDEVLGVVTATEAVLRSYAPQLPSIGLTTGDLDVVRGFVGEEYARFTPAGMEAVSLMRREAGVALEGTYTGKTFAALLSWGRAGRLRGRNVLFWDTYNSRDLTAGSEAVSIDRVPARLRTYFEEPTQELDT
jgi:1-aminocyclopropane-1-carboxylate deaminase/D-cysteine desulfhydrase-like pyridoxal-dependent ACC family enzyme